MKKIVTSNITDQARLPLLKRTIEFIKENDAETSTASLYAMLGNNSDAVPIILWGCNPTITTASIAGDTLTITEGAILYDGEIYQVAAGSAVFTAGQVHTLIVVATGQTEEPTKYTDNSEHITNINYTIAVSNGVTGSGICDWNNRNFYRQSVRDVTIDGTGDIFSSAPTTTNCTVTSINVAADKVGSTITIKGALTCTVTSNSPQMLTLNLKSKFNKLTNYVEYFPVTGVRYSGSSITPEVTELFTGAQNTGILRIAFTYTNGDILNYNFALTYQAY